jgi:hypothetical protein
MASRTSVADPSAPLPKSTGLVATIARSEVKPENARCSAGGGKSNLIQPILLYNNSNFI